MGENQDYDDYIRIRGLDENNKWFEYEEIITNTDGNLYLPFGKYEITIYNDRDKSIAAQEEIEIKEGIDYITNPIQLNFDIQKMREEAEPFKFKVEKVTDDSITLSWNNVSKIKDFIIYAEDYKKDRKSTRLNSSHVAISYAVFCLKKKKIYYKNPATTTVVDTVPLAFVYGRGVGSDLDAQNN